VHLHAFSRNLVGLGQSHLTLDQSQMALRSYSKSGGALGKFATSRKSNRMDPRMTFKQLANETLNEAWKCYHGFMTDLPTAGMEDWKFN
jgi:hypothetical protein